MGIGVLAIKLDSKKTTLKNRMNISMRLTLLSIIYLLSWNINAQPTEKRLRSLEQKGRWTTDSVYKKNSYLQLEASWIETLLNPGGSFGIGMPLQETIFFKNTKDGVRKTWEKTSSVVFATGFYNDPNLHSALNIHFFYKQKKESERGWFTYAFYGIGTTRTYLSGNTYSVSYQGVVTKVKHAGYWYFSPSLSVGSGYNLRSKYHLPIDLQIGIGIQSLMPYANSLLLRPRIELGVCYDLSFISLPYNRKIKTKNEDEK